MGEAKILTTVSFIVAALMIYARWASTKLSPGFQRLLALLPPILILALLPFSFSTCHLRLIFGFFIGWLCVFKLALLAFSSGPLHPSLSLLTFISTATLPVKLQEPNKSNDPSPASPAITSNFRVLSSTAFKLALLFALFSIYPYKHAIHPNLLTALYCCHTYLSLEVALAFSAAVGRALLSMDLEPQFNAPYLSTSLQDFWGRRWNLIVSGILRPSVYLPVRARCGTATAVMATFLVSGVMHEIAVVYLAPSTRSSGELTCFFLLHGLCLLAEMKLKQRWRWSLHPVLAAPLVLGFVAATASWLFFPPFLSTGIEATWHDETAAMSRFFQDGARALTDRTGIKCSL